MDAAASAKVLGIITSFLLSAEADDFNHGIKVSAGDGYVYAGKFSANKNPVRICDALNGPLNEGGSHWRVPSHNTLVHVVTADQNATARQQMYTEGMFSLDGSSYGNGVLKLKQGDDGPFSPTATEFPSNQSYHLYCTNHEDLYRESAGGILYSRDFTALENMGYDKGFLSVELETGAPMFNERSFYLGPAEDGGHLIGAFFDSKDFNGTVPECSTLTAFGQSDFQAMTLDEMSRYLTNPNLSVYLDYNLYNDQQKYAAGAVSGAYSRRPIVGENKEGSEGLRAVFGSESFPDTASYQGPEAYQSKDFLVGCRYKIYAKKGVELTF